MEKGEKECSKYTVVLTKRCDKEYRKFVKKADPKLVKIVNSSIDQLETNAQLGEQLTEDLKGFYSIHIDEFRFRIVYGVSVDSDCTIEVHSITHRNSVYTELARYLGRE